MGAFEQKTVKVAQPSAKKKLLKAGMWAKTCYKRTYFLFFFIRFAHLYLFFYIFHINLEKRNNKKFMPLLNIFFLYSPPPLLQFNIVYTVNFILSLFRLILQIEDLHVPCVEWENGTTPLYFYTRRPKPKEAICPRSM